MDAAVGAARQAVSLAAPASLEWATPVLYLRAPDAVLFDLKAGASASAGSGDPSPDEAQPTPVRPAEPASGPRPSLPATVPPPARPTDLAAQALGAYVRRQWHQAALLLERYLESHPEDGEARRRLEEARRLQQPQPQGRGRGRRPPAASALHVSAVQAPTAAADEPPRPPPPPLASAGAPGGGGVPGGAGVRPPREETQTKSRTEEHADDL